MSKKKNLKAPSRGFSLYSSDSEDPMVKTHKGLDRCASLLAHIMESPVNDGDRKYEGRGKQRETTGVKAKPKKTVKKKSCKEEKSKVKVQPKVDKKVTTRAERKNQPGRKKSKSAHHQAVFQPGLVSSTPQKKLHREEKPQQGHDTEQSVQAQAIQQNYNQVRGQVPNTLGRVIQSSRFGSTGHYGDQMIPERDTSQESRHLEQDLRGQNDSRQIESSKRCTIRNETEVVKQRYKHKLSGGLSTVGGYHGFKDDHLHADIESSTSNEIVNLLNEPQGNMQNGIQWSIGGVAGVRQRPPESHDGKGIGNFIHPSMHERIPMKEMQYGIHNKGVEPQPHVDGISDAFTHPSVAPADENHVARNVLRDLVNTLKSINERESTCLTTNPKVGNQAVSPVSATTDGEMKGWMSKCDSQTLGMKERTDDAARNVTEMRGQSPPVNTAGFREVQDLHLKDDRQATYVEKYPVGYGKEEDSEVVKDFELERKMKRDTFPQEKKNEMMRNAQISPETCISRENHVQIEDRAIPGEKERTKSLEQKKKRKFESASAGPKSKTKRALWEQQRVLKCLVMELKAVTEQKENLEVQRLFGEILQTIDTLPYLTMDCDVQTEIAMGLQPLRSENAQLRRKLRISNQQMKEIQKTEQQQQSFEVIALKTLNATLQGQLEAEQKDSATSKEKVEILTQEMEALGKKCEELTQLLELKDESHLRSQRDWITEMATLRKQQTYSKQELETTKSSLDSLRRENMFLLKSLEESKKMLQEYKEERTSPSRKRNWEFGGLENMPKVTREADRKTRFDVEDTSGSERTVDTNEAGEESGRDVFMSSHRSRSNEKTPLFSPSTKQNPSSDETSKIPYHRENGQCNQDRALEGEFAMKRYFSAGDGNLSNLNTLSDSEVEWQKNHDQMESILPTVSRIQTGKTHVKMRSDEKQKHKEHRKEAHDGVHTVSHNAFPEETELQTATMVSDSESFGKLRDCDISVVDDEQGYSLPPYYTSKFTNMQRLSSMPPGPSQGSSVPYRVVPGPYHGAAGPYQDASSPYQGATGPYQNAVSPYKGTLLQPHEVSKAIDQVSCVSESTASSITSLFEAQFQLGLSNLDDKIAKLQENLKYYKTNKNT